MEESNLRSRGDVSSPIAIIGHSLPKNNKTKERLKELLDRRHVAYKSLIIPLKYSINEYLLEYHRYKLPNDWNNEKDIFYYINAYSYSEDNCLELNKEEINSIINNRRVRIIICMGGAVFKEVVNHIGEAYKGEKPEKYSIQKLGEIFEKNVSRYKKDKTARLIIPILHNAANLKFDYTDRFIPEGKRKDYITYNDYIAKELGKVLMSEKKLRKFLRKLK